MSLAVYLLVTAPDSGGQFQFSGHEVGPGSTKWVSKKKKNKNKNKKKTQNKKIN